MISVVLRTSDIESRVLSTEIVNDPTCADDQASHDSKCQPAQIPRHLRMDCNPRSGNAETSLDRPDEHYGSSATCWMLAVTAAYVDSAVI
jgi:hypothetical protein